MYGIRNKSPAETEMIDVLLAISHVSARLARNLIVLAEQSQFEKGENHHESTEQLECHH